MMINLTVWVLRTSIVVDFRSIDRPDVLQFVWILQSLLDSDFAFEDIYRLGHLENYSFTLHKQIIHRISVSQGYYRCVSITRTTISRIYDNSLNPLQQSDKTGKQHFSSRRIGRKVGEEWWCRLRNARTALHQAKDRMTQNADKNRVERSFEIGDYVLLTSKYLNLKKPSVAKKFCPVFVGPVKVAERIGRLAYNLLLPNGCKTHDVIHVSKLWKYHQAPGDNLDVENPLWVDGENLPEVSDMLESRGSDENRYYLVHYKNRDNMYCTWEPWSGCSRYASLR